MCAEHGSQFIRMAMRCGPGALWRGNQGGPDTCSAFTFAVKADIRRFFDRILSEDGYYIISVGTARRARHVVFEADRELLIVDLSLPDEDGVELVRQMRLDHPHLKILATSGFLAGNLPEIVIAAGAAATLQKPTVPKKLRNAVKRLLEPSVGQGGSQPTPPRLEPALVEVGRYRQRRTPVRTVGLWSA